VTISLPDRTLQIRTSAATIAGALEGAGLATYEADTIQPSPDSPVVDGMAIRVVPSRSIRVQVDGATLRARASAPTVGGALAQAGVSMVGLDYARPAADQPVPVDGGIQVVRVSEEVRIELTPIAFDTQYQPLSEVEIDQQQLIKTGAYGVQASQVRVRYEDGVESGQLEEGTWEARSPEDRVVGYGTQIVVRKVATDDGTIEYWRAIKMWATSYSPSRAGVSPEARNFGITASGKPLTKGLVAIDRRYIPFGTPMYVPGYGYALAADTGSGVKGRWIDLGYDDDNWVSWHQYVTVYFLTPVPPESSIVWIFP
jgi:resuscitation-promoting factor RpfB